MKRRPFSLRCGHCICEICLESKKIEQVPVICGACNVSTDKLEDLSVDFALKSMLESKEVFCSQDHNEIGTYFCFTHIVSMCDECLPKHKALYANDEHIIPIFEQQQFAMSLSEYCKSVHDEPTLSPASKTILKNCCSKPLKDVIKILQELYDPLKCSSCGSKELKFVNLIGPAGIRFACANEEHKSTASDDGSGFFEWLPLPGHSRTEITTFLQLKAKQLLRSIPSAFLYKKSLKWYRTRIENSDVSQICDSLIYLMTDNLRGRNSQKPQSVQCLSCKSWLNYMPGQFYKLKCANVDHEICVNCATRMIPSMMVECPIDNMAFAVDDLEAQLAKLVVQAPQEVAKVQENYVQTDEGKPIDLQRINLGDEIVTFSLVPSAYPTCPYVSIFDSVIPALGTPIEQAMRNNKPWHIHPRKNTVEAITMVCFSDAALVGMTLSAPTTPGLVVNVDYVKVYRGEQAIGMPIYEQGSIGILGGGNSVSQDLWFANPIRLNACTQYTLKAKIARYDCDWTFTLFRGNPFKRPDPPYSTLEDTWEFSECKSVDQGEQTNGQCNLSGPFLRFYYTK